MPTYQDLFDAVIGTEPPAALDIDELVARFRRRLRRRRAAAAAATALAVAVVAIGGSAAAGHWPAGWTQRQPQVGDSPRTDSTPTPAATPTRSAVPTRGPEPTEAASAADGRLTAAMQAAVLEVAKGGQLLPFVSGGKVPFELVPYAQAEPSLPYRGNAHVLIDGREGATNITIEVGIIGSPPPGCAQTTDCVESVGPAGERIVASTITTTRGSGLPLADVVQDVPGVEHTVWVLHPAGDYVTVYHHNFPEGGDAPVALPVLTRDELVQIALDPALTLYP